MKQFNILISRASTSITWTNSGKWDIDLSRACWSISRTTNSGKWDIDLSRACWSFSWTELSALESPDPAEHGLDDEANQSPA